MPVPGLTALLDQADGAGVPMVAVTNAPRPNAELLLSGLGITHRFKAIVIGDELAHGKPHPLPYLEGLRLAGASADGAVAFEDSRSGIQSATAAGIATIGMRTGDRLATLPLPQLAALPLGQWKTLAVPLKCFAGAGADLAKVNAPFVLTLGGTGTISLSRVALGMVADQTVACAK